MADPRSKVIALRAPKQPFVEDNPFDAGSTVEVQGDPNPVSVDDDGVMSIENANGSVTIDFSPQTTPDEKDDRDSFDANLSKSMDNGLLHSIAAELLDAIERDNNSRQDWLDMRARGIQMLGLKLEEPRGDTGTSSAPLEGMSTIRHPLLLEATIAFQAGARGELLPAAGPVKVRNDNPPAAPPGQMAGDAPLDELAEALQKDLNHYLTVVAREYIPDTDRMLFMCPFSGDGFKKIYHCPLRRRPVSESVDAENLIISNAATDLQNCGRVTHKIRMRKSTLKRMQHLGVYRQVDLIQASPPKWTPTEEIKAEIAGYKVQAPRPEDEDFTIYEVYTELDLDEFAPKQFKGEGIPLPYRVTIEKDSRQVLDVRRNWDEDDVQCTARQFFVQFPFIRGLGFYGLGFVHLLGNSVVALTAAWREMIDAGMFANFPGFIFSKQVGRQLTNQFRVAPGGGIGIDLPSGQKIQDVVMPMPYKEVGPAFPALVKSIEDSAKQTAMTSNPNVGEGKQDAPVGTTLALLEQASKIISSAFKRLHTAQAEEFQLLKERFREDPEALWRNNKRPAVSWQRDQFLQALNKYELVPCADPNSPTSLHRVMKAMAVKQLQAMNPQLYDPVAVDKRIMSVIGIDPEGLFKPPTPPGQPQQPDPMMLMLQMRMRLEELKLQSKQQELALKKQIADTQAWSSQQDTAGRQRIENIKQQISQQKNEQEYINERLKIVSDEIMHHHEMIGDEQQRQHEMGIENIRAKTTAQQSQMEHSQNMTQLQLQHHNTMQQGAQQGQLAERQGQMDHQNVMAQNQTQNQHEAQQGMMDRGHENIQNTQQRGHEAQQSQREGAMQRTTKLAEQAMSHEHESQMGAEQRAHESKEKAQDRQTQFKLKPKGPSGGSPSSKRRP
jgi:hypothetical protein